ncbi:sn-glycerol-1-phosphate dehydrogenase [Ruminococcus sp. 5_1_39BFAA]|uniref:sn-glycerol-1-phosphate dehydrogenase n=1 Tax=Ruminococcus sp. 5_1_39BFAA TaxID=457412 RepID=UPI0035647D8D
MRVDADDFGRPCGCGKEHHIEVKEILIEAGAIDKLEEEMSDGFLKQYISPLLICDTNTCRATEEIMEEIFDRCQVLVLEAEGLHADNLAVEIVENNMDEDIDIILAVGSGTIHDISRYVAFQYRIPFISVPTAASVDGFVSTVAAMTWNGLKKTVPAAAPMCVYADTNIFANAPKRLTASGVSDLMGKYICLADWKIAHLLTGEYYCERIVEMEEKALKTVRGALRDIAAGEPEDCEKLMYGLILSGIAMQMAGNSRPASCAEHHMSHLWEMEVLNGPLDALHGEKVSVGMMTVLKEYRRIARAIREGRCQVKPYADCDEQLLSETFGKKGLLDGIRKENEPELLLDVSPERLKRCLPDIAEVIDDLPDEQEMEHLLDKAGCKKSVYDIGLEESIVPLSLQLAPYVRRRLSLLRVSKMLEIR